MSTPLKFAAFYDLHIGWERREGRNKETHNKAALKLALDFCKDYRPDIVILGGDQVNFGPVSHWNHGKPRNVEGLRVKDELDALEDLFLAPLEATLPPKARKIWHYGNHEKWFDDFICTNPALEGLTGIDEYLRIKKRGWETYSYGAISKVGKLRFTHGDTIGGGVNLARNAALRYLCNIRFGHHHTYQAYTLHSQTEDREVKTAVSIPCLCSRAPSYQQNAPNSWVNGWLQGFVWPDGTFLDSVSLIVKGKALVGDKIYE